MRRCFIIIGAVCLLAAGAVADSAEVPPAQSAPCFPGAYYRKAASSFDKWTGIDTVVKLPEADYDMSRTRANGRPLDNASIYIGGRAGDQEIDCGVNWEVIREADGSVSTIGKAYRPFARNEQWHSGPAKPEYYYYPGDVIRMKVENVSDGKLAMQIELLSRAGDAGTSVTRDGDVISSYSTTFDASEFRVDGIKQFKRVNGMDQSGNEGKPVQPTKTRITEATWREVYLLRGADRVPMTPERYTDMRCPDPAHIKVEPFGVSGERVTLIGNPEAE